jgi:hypothetical protein
MTLEAPQAEPRMPNIKIQRTGAIITSHRCRVFPAADLERTASLIIWGLLTTPQKSTLTKVASCCMLYKSSFKHEMECEKKVNGRAVKSINYK